MQTECPNREPTGEPSAPQLLQRPSRRRRLIYLAGAIILLYLLVAYVILPLAWKRDTRRHPDLSGGPRITHTPDGIPGDPVNLAIIGSESELVQAWRLSNGPKGENTHC